MDVKLSVSADLRVDNLGNGRQETLGQLLRLCGDQPIYERHNTTTNINKLGWVDKSILQWRITSCCLNMKELYPLTALTGETETEIAFTSYKER
ncbi:hypothetical protein J6590_000478 [Homalodisca vitripennis]|nr:hypothetical protein J6590_000478 [Homalodisca vitripennis]